MQHRTLFKFLPGVWRTQPLPDGTLFEVRAVNHGTPSVYYDCYELANPDSHGTKLRHISGISRLSQARRELFDYIATEHRP